MTGLLIMCAAAQRELKITTLANGINCVLVRDPQMQKVAVCFEIGAGDTSEPIGLNGIASVVMSTMFRGSAHYPGITNFLDFVVDNDVDFEGFPHFFYSPITAEFSYEVFDEYLDRISDMVTHPTLSEKELEFAKKRYVNTFYPCMTDLTIKEWQVREYLLFGKVYQTSWLFTRKDLLSKVREYFKCYYRPPNMKIYVMSGEPIKTMEQHIQKHFESIPYEPIISEPAAGFCTDLNFNKTLRVDDQAIFAKTFTKSEEKRLSLFFRLPPGSGISSPLFISYLLNTSQPGSLQYKLKLEGFLNHLFAEHKTFSVDFHELDIEISLTAKGSRNIEIILRYVFGYLDILKRIQPSYDLFHQAEEYFRCIRRLDSAVSILDRCRCELLQGSKLSDSRDAEIPRIFDPATIQNVLECLTLANCNIIAMSDQYADVPVQIGSEFFLQMRVDNFTTHPLMDGLMQPRLDPLLVSSRLPPVSDTELQLLCENPLVHQKSTADIYTKLSIGLKSLEFAQLSAPMQTLYAEMIHFQVWLELTKDICDIEISVVDSGLSIDVKSVPESLDPLVRLLVESLTSPIGSEYNEHFLAIRDKEKQRVCSMIDKCHNAEGLSDFDGIMRYNLETKLQELNKLDAVCSLPESIKGTLSVVFSGNANKQASLEITSILSILQK